MKAELMPKIQIEIRPIVQTIISNYGIENSALGKAIEDEIDVEIRNCLEEIPNMVKNELNKSLTKIINGKCFLKFNLNSHVLVRLNNYGKEILDNKNQKYDIDSSGYTEFQLWVLIEIFGVYIHNGFRPCFDTNILIGKV